MKRYMAILLIVAFGVAGNMDYQDQLLRQCKAKQPDNVPACMENSK